MRRACQSVFFVDTMAIPPLSSRLANHDSPRLHDIHLENSPGYCPHGLNGLRRSQTSFQSYSSGKGRFQNTSCAEDTAYVVTTIYGLLLWLQRKCGVPSPHPLVSSMSSTMPRSRESVLPIDYAMTAPLLLVFLFLASFHATCPISSLLN